MRHSARSPSRNGAPSRMLCARRYAGSSRSTLHTGASRRPSGSRWVDGGNFQFYEVVRDVALENHRRYVAALSFARMASDSLGEELRACDRPTCQETALRLVRIRGPASSIFL